MNHPCADSCVTRTLRKPTDSHLIFKIGHAEELAISGLADEPDGACGPLAPGPQALYTQWLREEWARLGT